MPTNRTVSVTSVFAQNASTNIPASPVAGSSYRNANMTTTEVEAGWPFKTIVDSSNFNQTMFELSSIAKQFEQYGFLPWSNLTNYPIGGFALGSNGTLYQALQATGPDTTAMDPTTDTNMTYWQAVQFGSHTGMVSPYAGSVAPTGWLICDGSAISRTTYSALFAVIGTTYGAGDGSTTFNIPSKTYFSGRVKGNGKSIGLTDKNGNNTTLMCATGPTRYYPSKVGFDRTLPYRQDDSVSISIGQTFGVVDDASKSGIICESDDNIVLVIKY